MVKNTAQRAIKDILKSNFLFSFRSRVFITVTIMILAIGFVAFHIFSIRLSKQLSICNRDNLQVILEILKEQYFFTIGHDGGKIIFPMLDRLCQNPDVLAAYLLDSEGHQIYPKDKSVQIEKDHTHFDVSTFVDSMGVYPVTTPDHHRMRSYLKIFNRPSCFGCHSQDKLILGYLFIDFSSEKEEKNVADTKNFGRLFTITIVVSLFFTVGYLHFRYIRNSLQKFKHTFQAIESGDLSHRVPLQEKDELGDLAKHLNETLDKLQQYQHQLAEYHRRELVRAQKLATIGEMASSFAHEIKNPLTGIVNAIDILSVDIDNPENRWIFNEIKNQSIRVNQAINDLLQFSKPVELYLRSGNINKLLQRIVKMLETQRDDKDIEFEMVLDTKLPLIQIDVGQLENAIINIGINAIQAIPRQGKITFWSCYHGDKQLCEIRISDNGTGIAEDNLQKIFKPFFTTKSQGTGLGLPIALDIIEKHGGNILVQSRVEEGTIFIIELPSGTNRDRKDGKIKNTRD